VTIAGIIFDFDGVLVESEWAGNEQIARTLTDLGYPTTVETALDAFMGLSGRHFVEALERHIGGAVPDAFHAARRAEDARVLADGVEAVAGALNFVAALPAALPRAIASSSTTHWIRTHLDHIGLRGAFEPHVYSGREHVTRGKPAPDIYLHAARQIGIDIAQTLIIEDSPVGVTGAVASGAQVVGLAVGRHCRDGHDARLRAAGAPHVVHSFDDVAALIAQPRAR
jgi:beta-phosphoglucomutase-like phosphatase (HAD superfamily)